MNVLNGLKNMYSIQKIKKNKLSAYLQTNISM